MYISRLKQRMENVDKQFIWVQAVKYAIYRRRKKKEDE